MKKGEFFYILFIYLFVVVVDKQTSWGGGEREQFKIKGGGNN